MWGLPTRRRSRQGVPGLRLSCCRKATIITYKLEKKRPQRESVKRAGSDKKRMSSDLMSVEDNRVADEDDTLLPDVTAPPYYWNAI